MTITETIIANKTRLGPDEALELAHAAKELWAAKGKKISSLKLSDEPSNDEILKLMLGPSGKLRAPTIRKGKKLFVGFNPDMFEEHIK